METNIVLNFSDFINFCAKDIETKRLVESCKNGVHAVEKVQISLTNLARAYVISKGGSVQFSQGVESTLIANEIVKLI